MAATRAVDIHIRTMDRASAGFKRVTASGAKMRSQLSRQGSGIRDDFAGFGQSMQTSLLGVIAKLGVLVLAFKTAKAAFVDFVGGGVTGVAQMERMQVTLATTTRDLGKAQELLESATKFAAQTPFEIPEIVEATVRLETYGLKSQEVLTTIGDMASVMGKPLMQAVEAVADAQTGELERLKEFGITKRQLIEAGLAVNAQGQIQDMKSLNDALMSIMEERFGGGMRLMAQTFNGIVSNLKDAWGTFKRALAAPTFEVIKNALRDLLGWVNRLQEKGTLDEWANRVGQAIAKAVRVVIAFPKIFKLVIDSFIGFLKALSNWDFFLNSLISLGKFIIDTFVAIFKTVVQIVSSVAKVIWIPLLRSFSEVFVSGITNMADLVATSFKTVFSGKIFSKEKTEKAMNELEDRVIGRLDNIGTVWNVTWEQAGGQFSGEMAKVLNSAQGTLGTIGASAKENLLPIFKEGIGDEMVKQWEELAATLNQDVTPSALQFNLAQKDTIQGGKDIVDMSKKEKAEHIKTVRAKEDAERQFNARLIELTLGETALRVAELRNQRNKYLEFGFDRIQVERLYHAELAKLDDENLQRTAAVTDGINQILMTGTEVRLGEIEKQRQAYLKQGVDQVAVEQWASLQRLQIQVEADKEIRREGLFTVQTLTSQWGTFLGFARRGFRLLAGQSNETWQAMVADIIEWGTGLVAQYLIARGLELLRRAEGAKTHAQFLRHHGEEMIALAGKLALMGDLVRAGIAAGLGAASLVRAEAVDKEAAALTRAAKASIGLGLAVEAGGAIASEALQQWGSRAQDARKKQDDLNRSAQGLSTAPPSGIAAAPSSAGMVQSPIPVEVIRVAEPVRPEPTPIAAAPATQSGNAITFTQNNHFEGLVNFDNEEALRELARKLRPFSDEFSETFATA